MIKESFSRARRITRFAVLTALSLVVFRVEALFPPLVIPGAKIGLSNIFSLMMLVSGGYLDALLLVVVRTFLGSLFAGGLSSLIYSMTAGIASITLSFFLLRVGKISILAISVASATMHNAVQILIFCVMSQTAEMFVYMPYLALAGVLAGAVIGATVTLLLGSKQIQKALKLNHTGRNCEKSDQIAR